MTSSYFLQLPEESKRLIAHFLPAPDVLNMVSTHPVLHRLHGMSRHFWDDLRQIQYPSSSECPKPTAAMIRVERDAHDTDANQTWEQAKDAYLLRAHCQTLPLVRWYPVAGGRQAPTAREGHLSCALGHYIVLTGGYSGDENIVYVKDIRTGESWQRIVIEPGATLPLWAYGATLTPLDEHRAVRFGGFHNGGYSAEIYQVAILHLDVNDEATGNRLPKAHWEIVTCKMPDGSVVRENDSDWTHIAARAYHTATLLFDRFLLVLGGMQSLNSVLKPIILDCETWTWCYEGITTCCPSVSPSPRHGCSVVTDLERRGRLVMFGGGDGADLLRSGRDTTEVWELNMNGCLSADSLLHSLPWKWRRLHADQNIAEHNEADVSFNNTDRNRLSPAEKLTLGRCHGACRVSTDTVLLAFGSGRPTTNSIICYNLSRDEFFRTVVRGPLPRARFTFVSVFLKSLGYLVINGGFSTQEGSEALSDTCVLDLAPGLRRRQFRLWPIDLVAESYPPVTDAMASQFIGGAAEIMDHIVNALVNTEEAERPAMARRMFAFLQSTQRLDGRPATFLHLISTGGVRLMDDGGTRVISSNGDDSEEDYHVNR